MEGYCFKTCRRDKNVDPCYGLYEFVLDDSDMKALRSGKKLYSTINFNEYAITIIYQPDKEE